MHSRLLALLALEILGAFSDVVAQTNPVAPVALPFTESSNAFLNFVQVRAVQLRAGDVAPASLADWNKQRAELRANLMKAWGDWPKQPAPLNPKKLGELQRDGYRVEKIIFQTLPDVWMTSNAYVPDKPGKLPTVVCVHGHWRGAKQDPVVQSRCIGLAKLGFFVLVVDAFGAGERGVGKALGEYHGEMTAATVFPVGLPLSGLQVCENMRAVDYLLTRPEVDGARLGITGASGGGNQTMYAGAFDERFKAVVPVCSVGNYQAYLGAACCMCEVVPGALKFTEEWGLLAMVAPRALMVVSATKDAPQFSVAAAQKSLAFAQPVFALHGNQENVKHAIFESPHAYNQPMREAMYGWMTKHLKGEGDGSPIPEPKFQTEEPETLRCFPGETRPDDWMTIPKFARRVGEEVVKKRALNAAKFVEEKPRMISALRELASAKSAVAAPAGTQLFDPAQPFAAFQIATEAGVNATVRVFANGAKWQDGAALVLEFGNDATAANVEFIKAIESGKNPRVHFRLRATGADGPARDSIGRARDHNSAEWSMWLGRPLLGQWTHDVVASLDQLEARQKLKIANATIVGVGAAGVVAMCVAAIDPRIGRCVTVGSLASYLTDKPYEGQRLGIMAPGIVRDIGDIPQIAALIAPRKLIIAEGVAGDGRKLTESELEQQFDFTRQIYRQEKSAENLRIISRSYGPSF